MVASARCDHHSAAQCGLLALHQERLDFNQIRREGRPRDVGEVLVTSLNPDYPLIRFATGDLSAIAPGISKCGRTNSRIVGWRGRADQATKVKGMFVRPEQVAILKERYPEIKKIRVSICVKDNKDSMTLKVETDKPLSSDFDMNVKDVLKLMATVEVVSSGALPNDGIIIEDLRPSTVT